MTEKQKEDAPDSLPADFHFRYEIEEVSERKFIVRLFGSIDGKSIYDFDALASRLAGVAKLAVFDLKGLSYISSLGVGTLVDLGRRLQRGGGKLLIVELPEKIRRVLELSSVVPFMNLLTMEKAREEFFHEKS